MNKNSPSQSGNIKATSSNLTLQSFLKAKTSKITTTATPIPKNTKSNSFVINTNINPHTKNIEETLLKIFELHGHLNHAIQQMDANTDRIIAQQQREYLIAFKNISTNLHKELERIKKNMDGISTKIVRHSKSNELENQIESQKDEEKKYYIANENNLKIIQELRQKQNQLEVERENLLEQLQIAKTEFKNMKKEYLGLLEEISHLKLKNKQYERELLVVANQNSLIKNSQVKQVKLDLSKTFQEADSPTTTTSHPNSPNKITKHNLFCEIIIEEYLKKHKNPDKLAENFVIYAKKIEDAKNSTIEKLKNLINKERMEKMKLNEYIASTLSEISDYEILFVECVKAVKNDIIRRNLLNGSFNQNIEADISNLKTFLDLDKTKILELFVMTEQVTLGIYELMFPNKKFQVNNLLKPIIEKMNSEQCDTNNSDLSMSNLGDDQPERLQGDRSDFNQSYHFENLMMLLKSEQDLKHITSAPTSTKHSRKPSSEILSPFQLH